MLIRGILLALPVLMCAVAVCTPVAGAVPLMQLPWPAGDQHRIYGGYTYGCGTHATSTAPGSYPHIADYYAIDFQFGPVDGSPLDVSSAADGVVIVRADLGDGFGNKVVVDHGGGFYSVYAHFRSSNPWGPGISVGVQVTMGQLLGYAGDTGGPYAVHLHFHLQSGFSAVEAEPMSGVPGPGEPGFGWYGFSMENGAGCHANPNDPSPYWTSTPPFAGTDTPGVWRNREWYLRNDLSPGWPDCSFEYGVSTDTPVMGDWDGDGVDTVGIVRQYATQLQWHLRNDNSGGAGFSFIYGLNTDTPIVGDWNGDGVDSPGIVRPTPPGTQLEWHLIDEIGQPQADVYIYGLSSDKPLSGDWNGDGVDWFGITRPNPNGVQRDWHLIDSSGQQNADVYTFGHASDRAVTGDWNGDGKTFLGITRSDQVLGLGLEWHVINEIPGGLAVPAFVAGFAADTPVVGDLDHASTLSCANLLPSASPSLAPCGNNPLDVLSTAERVDGTFAGVDDNGDVGVDEPLPASAGGFDCDGDGYTGSAENEIYSYAGQTNGDQKTCGEYDLTHPNPNANTKPSLRWPSDFVFGSVPDSTNRITIGDLSSFTAPIRYLGTYPGHPDFDARWDIVPGMPLGGAWINVLDLSAMTSGPTGYPPMLGGVQAYNGPPCPWPE